MVATRFAVLAATLLALAAPTAAEAAAVRTLVTAKGPIAAFAHDRGRIAWAGVDPGVDCPWRVRIRILASGLQTGLNRNRGHTCRHDVGFQEGPGSVALALGGTTAIWTLRSRGSSTVVDVIASSLSTRRERRIAELRFDNAYGAGDHLGGLAGDGSLLVVSQLVAELDDSAGCDAAGDCTTHATAASRLLRLAGAAVVSVPGATPAFAPSAATDRVAYVQATVERASGPQAPAGAAVEVRSAFTGALVSSFKPPGRVLALALTDERVAVLLSSETGSSIRAYATGSGALLGSWEVPAATSGELDLAKTRAVYRVGRTVRLLDLESGRSSVVAVARARPIGLSIEGRLVAWAENSAGRGRVKAVAV